MLMPTLESAGPIRHSSLPTLQVPPYTQFWSKTAFERHTVKRTHLSALLLTTIFILAGCRAANNDSPAVSTGEPASDYQNVSVEAFQRMMDDKDFLLVN